MNQLPKIQEVNLDRKVVLVRVDHNVVKKGKIKDTYRIDVSLPTIKHILAKGGRPVLMTHVGRPRNKKTGEIMIAQDSSVQPIVRYLEHKLDLRISVPSLPFSGTSGIKELQIPDLLTDLKNAEIDLIYLPNTRWFAGEESTGAAADKFGSQLAELADIFVNDAFGSWQPHTSTIKPAQLLPSFAGLLMQKELTNLNKIFTPQKPLTAIVAGAKFDTKIGPLKALLELSDHLILGGVIYNAYLCAKYGIKIKGVPENEIEQAKDFLFYSRKYPGKIIELPKVIESEFLDKREEKSIRPISISELREGSQLNYVLDVSPASFQDEKLINIIGDSGTVFVNAVMGLFPYFPEGTKELYRLIDSNKKAMKLYGGGDTLQEFKNLLPEIHNKAQDKADYYFFTGGGAVLKAIQENSGFGMEPVQALLNPDIQKG